MVMVVRRRVWCCNCLEKMKMFIFFVVNAAAVECYNWGLYLLISHSIYSHSFNNQDASQQMNIVFCGTTMEAWSSSFNTEDAFQRVNSRYIGVGEDETVQLFYFFVESEGNPEEDPLIIWLAEGPGCSNLHAFFFEISPLKIQNGKYIDDVPALQADPNSWTK
ncbi:peptidase S10, serine carboxypeptidase, alpha/beta hydrolase fold protein, partial [Tanacetum coccineum]